MVTTIVTAQKISETTPNTFCVDTGTGCGSDGLKTVCTVYSGLVPISPNTTPRAPTASAAWALPRLITLSHLPLRNAHPSGRPGTIHAADRPGAPAAPAAAGRGMSTMRTGQRAPGGLRRLCG